MRYIFALLATLAIAACGTEDHGSTGDGSTGSINVQATMSSLTGCTGTPCTTPDGVESIDVVLTSTGSHPAVSFTLHRADNFAATVKKIYTGTYAVTATANSSAGIKFQNLTTSVTITKNATAALHLIFNELTDAVTQRHLRFSSISLDKTIVDQDETITFTTGLDLGTSQGAWVEFLSEDMIWEAASPVRVDVVDGQAAYTWTAPSFAGPITMYINARDIQGNSTAFQARITVDGDKGHVDVDVAFNAAPELSVAVHTSDMPPLEMFPDASPNALFASFLATILDDNYVAGSWTLTSPTEGGCQGEITNAVGSAGSTLKYLHIPATSRGGVCKMVARAIDQLGAESSIVIEIDTTVPTQNVAL